MVALLFALAIAAGPAMAQSVPTPSSLNINDPSSLGAATAKALQNLMTYYTPNSGGVFNQVETPWHESGMIWGTFCDYTKWSGDTQFMDTVINALANASYNNQQDFLGGSLVTEVETILGRWNDDILWPSQAVIAAGEIYGVKSTMAGTGGGNFFTAPQKTFDEAYEQWDGNCSGGIYWSRDRTSAGANYKSVITQLEFISQGARNYIQQQNDTALALAEKALDWTLGASGLGNTETGVLFDGVNVGACDSPTTSQWSYNYGELIGALSWMHKATGNATYLDLAKPFLAQALATFAGSNVSGIVTEQCEPTASCNRDQQGFKAILLRNLVYLWRETSDSSVKQDIQQTIDTTVAGMTGRGACEDNDSWTCNGNWSVSGVEPVAYVRSQHVTAALLVAAMGIHTSSTGTGLLTNVNGSNPTSTSSGETPSNSGWYTSQPYNPSAAPPRPAFALPAVALALVLSILGAGYLQ